MHWRVFQQFVICHWPLIRQIFSFSWTSSWWTSWWKMFVCFSYDQAALWTLQSVRLYVRSSVCPSVTPFSKSSCHPIIMKFSGDITMDKSDAHARVKVRGQRSRSQRSKQILYQFGPIRKRRFIVFQVNRQSSWSPGTKNRQFLPELGVSRLEL